MKMLVTGGAGYIGSHMVHYLIDKGNEVIILDNMSTGFEQLIHPKAIFVKGDICDRTLVESLLEKHKVDAVFHFAAHIKVDESITHPYHYYYNNTYGSLQLFQACHNVGVQKLIFSSTAAVYGSSVSLIDETHMTQPVTPYGHSKLMAEKMLYDISLLGRLHYVTLRYFNVAGANSDAHIGQLTRNSTHLVKVAAKTACGKRASITIHGTDYPTGDGTCVRDYIHVQDLVSAHYRALFYLSSGGQNDVFNLGYGKGASVREVIECMKKVSGVDFPTVNGPRRAGDGPILVANSSKAKRLLSWTPSYDNLETICSSAYQWEKKLAHTSE